MAIFLDVLYLLFLIMVAPVILYRMIRFGKYREGFAEKFLGGVPRIATSANDASSPSTRKRLWFHAVSVGEVNLLKPILAQIETLHPDWESVISTTSKTGHQLARKLFPEKTVFYCPLDFSWAVRRALKRIRPDMLVLVELELWPNFITLAHRAGVKTAIVNGRISDGSFKNYRRVRFLGRRVLRRLDLIAASDDHAADFFRRLGADPERLIVTGSIKFDGVKTERKNPKTRELATLAGIRPFDEKNPDMVFLAGSTQDPEEALALTTFKSLADDFPNLKLVLVPRHPERFEAVARLLDASGLKWTRRTLLKTPEAASTETRILLVDTVGELGAWWGTATIAFVGGSMGSRGGQNMLEPAGYGAAVGFGPNTKNFREIAERMIRQNAAIVIHNGDEMTAFVRHGLTDPAWRTRLGENARELVKSQSGACQKTIEALEKIVGG